MSTTAQEVFETAMNLMDDVNESTGAADTSDTKEYKNRTLAILNLLRGELFPYSDTYEATEAGKRPIAAKITDFVTPIGLDDYICQSVMPYGLAAHLLMQEDPSSANFFQQRYDELKSLLARGMPAESADIEDIYGVCGGLSPYNEFGMWS